VDSGAAVNFVLPFTAADGAAWWRSQLADIEGGTIRVLLARLDGGVVGVTLLILSRKANSPHRAEVSKVLVHRRARGRGIGTALMRAVEQLALSEGRWLLLLDTMQGSDAERLYRALGWQELGVVPNHALNVHGEPWPTTFFWKDLRP
jgi:GNAT superfamily N-acetyltransferase